MDLYKRVLLKYLRTTDIGQKLIDIVLLQASGKKSIVKILVRKTGQARLSNLSEKPDKQTENLSEKLDKQLVRKTGQKLSTWADTYTIS